MLIEKDNAAMEEFNRWTINGVAYPMTSAMVIRCPSQFEFPADCPGYTRPV
jgi:hypothetical protein